MKNGMFLGADKAIFQRAEALRNSQTETEKILWEYLRTKPFGCKFRRQHPLISYVADFYCHSLKLIIEIDGSVHEDKDVAVYDIERQKNLEVTG
jgi:cyclase